MAPGTSDSVLTSVNEVQDQEIQSTGELKSGVEGRQKARHQLKAYSRSTVQVIGRLISEGAKL